MSSYLTEILLIDYSPAVALTIILTCTGSGFKPGTALVRCANIYLRRTSIFKSPHFSTRHINIFTFTYISLRIKAYHSFPLLPPASSLFLHQITNLHLNSSQLTSPIIMSLFLSLFTSPHLTHTASCLFNFPHISLTSAHLFLHVHFT